MKVLSFDYQIADVNLQKLEKELHLSTEIERIQQATKSGYQTPSASINLLDDTKMLKEITDLAAQKKAARIKALVVIGIGGSNLGAKAVYEALTDVVNIDAEAPTVYWADTVDPDYIGSLLKAVESHLQKKESVLLFVASKSGTTTETVANAELFIQLLQRYHGKHYHNSVVISTNRDSALWKLGQAHHITCLSIPAQVGGRFSVLSSAGLFPLAVLGIDIHALIKGALAMREASLQKDIAHNPAALSASILYALQAKGYTIHDTFLFAVQLESLGKWYRQLLGESIGKRFTRDGVERERGITPTVSIGSTDLHSVGQLYLGGPHDKVTTFVHVQQWSTQLCMPDFPEYDTLVSHIQGIPFEALMDAIFQGVQKVYMQDKRPFMTITMPEKNAYYIGQFMQMKMLEIMYLGYLCNINPFDQPEVERYKINTKALLAHE